MHKRPIIKYFLSSLLILVFAVAVTPKIVLHDLAAHHTDTFIKLSDVHADQINKSVFQCALDHLVAESPFIDDGCPIELSVPLFSFIDASAFFQTSYFSEHLIFGLRGPPAFI